MLILFKVQFHSLICGQTNQLQLNLVNCFSNISPRSKLVIRLANKQFKSEILNLGSLATTPHFSNSNKQCTVVAELTRYLSKQYMAQSTNLFLKNSLPNQRLLGEYKHRTHTSFVGEMDATMEIGVVGKRGNQIGDSSQ